MALLDGLLVWVERGAKAGAFVAGVWRGWRGKDLPPTEESLTGIEADAQARRERTAQRRAGYDELADRAGIHTETTTARETPLAKKGLP